MGLTVCPRRFQDIRPSGLASSVATRLAPIVVVYYEGRHNKRWRASWNFAVGSHVEFTGPMGGDRTGGHLTMPPFLAQTDTSALAAVPGENS
jgi:hypothetical protein